MFEGDQTRCKLAIVYRPPDGRSAYLIYKIAWVPRLQAYVGKSFTLRCPAGLWLNGWEVMEVYETLTESGQRLEACDLAEAG